MVGLLKADESNGDDLSKAVGRFFHILKTYNKNVKKSGNCI